MQLLSKLPFKTQKSMPSGSDNRGTGLLLQAGMIRMTLAGAYSFTTLGLRTLRKIENIVREEMNAIGSAEVLMSALWAKESWEKTWRWDTVDVLFKLPAAENREYALNPTHEEVITPLIGEFIQSYKDLDNCSAYQIQWKFRNEKRAKSWLLRGREFLMKDAYSFHRSQEELDTYFEIMHGAYDRVFDRIGLADSTYYTFASWGDFSKYSYEFQTELSIGEDEIYICKKCGQAHNLEIIDPNAFVCAECGHTEYDKKIVSEVGNIFKLGSRFSDAFGLKYQDKDGKIQEHIFYGVLWNWYFSIGWVSLLKNLLMKKDLFGQKAIAPYSHVLIVIGDHLEEAKWSCYKTRKIMSMKCSSMTERHDSDKRQGMLTFLVFQIALSSQIKPSKREGMSSKEAKRRYPYYSCTLMRRLFTFIILLLVCAHSPVGMDILGHEMRVFIEILISFPRIRYDSFSVQPQAWMESIISFLVLV
jgi:prolyl-tRNA synthetase